MSRGMPSMTALLGMLAIAGYQNRDKLADMFRNATSGQPSGAKDSLSGMLGNLGGFVGVVATGYIIAGTGSYDLPVQGVALMVLIAAGLFALIDSSKGFDQKAATA